MLDKEMLGYIDGCPERGVTDFEHADIFGNHAVEDALQKALNIRPSMRAEI
jgi:predicted oxidoreductase